MPMTRMGSARLPQWRRGDICCAGELADHREQDALILEQVRLEVGRQFGHGVCHVGQLGIPFVDRGHLVGQRAHPWQRIVQVGVMVDSRWSTSAVRPIVDQSFMVGCNVNTCKGAKDLADVKTVCDASLRRVILSTNAIGSLDARFRRAVRACGISPTSRPLKCLCLEIRSPDPTGRGEKRWAVRWQPAQRLRPRV